MQRVGAAPFPKPAPAAFSTANWIEVEPGLIMPPLPPNPPPIGRAPGGPTNVHAPSAAGSSSKGSNPWAAIQQLWDEEPGKEEAWLEGLWEPSPSEDGPVEPQQLGAKMSSPRMLNLLSQLDHVMAEPDRESPPRAQHGPGALNGRLAGESNGTMHMGTRWKKIVPATEQSQPLMPGMRAADTLHTQRQLWGAGTEAQRLGNK